MAKATDNQPCLNVLRGVGYPDLSAVDGLRNVFKMPTPVGEVRLILYKRNKVESGQYWNGVRAELFGTVDLNVFWAADQSRILIVPSPFLASVLSGIQRAQQLVGIGGPKITPDSRWHVNVYFWDHGRAVLKPVNWRQGEPPSLEQFAHPVPMA